MNVLAARILREFERRCQTLKLSRLLAQEFERVRYAKQWKEEEHPRDKDGEFTNKGRQRKVRRTPGQTTKPPKQKTDSAKSARAKQAYNACTKEKQDASEALEHEASRIFGIEKNGDNLPMDLTSPNGMVGVEIKMLHDSKVDRVHMRKDSRQRKEAWIAAKKGRRAYTIVVDNRDRYQNGAHKDKYSGTRVFWTEGVGGFRFGQMNKANSLEEVKKHLGL